MEHTLHFFHGPLFPRTRTMILCHSKRTLGIVFALTKFHYYLWGRFFTLYTDHRALAFIHTQRELNAMLTGWHETILSYDFKVEYRPGVLNTLPDHLSRLFPQAIQDKHRTDENYIINAYMHVWQGTGKESSHNTMRDKRRQQVILKRVRSLSHLGANAMVRSVHADVIDDLGRLPHMG